MKILFLTEGFGGGGSKSSKNLAIISSKFADVAFFGIGDGYHSKEYTFINSKASSALSFRYVLDFLKALKRIRPHIVHVNGMLTGVYGLIGKLISRDKYLIVLTLRHTSTKFRINFLSKRLIPLLNKVDLIHYLTHYQYELYKSFKLSPQKYKVLPNIIFVNNNNNDIEIDSLRNRLLEQTTAEVLIISLGRIVASKQLDVFIETISIINQRGFNVGGVIVGAGDNTYLGKLSKLSKDLQIQRKIQFVDYTPIPEVYIRAGDFCLFPTQWAEGIPRFIIESFSCRRTLVVSNHPSIQGVVANRSNVLVTTKHSPQDYANNCIELITDSKLRSKLEENAIKTYNQSYKVETIAQEYQKMYDDLMIE